jgi:hypothetical protein
LRHDAGDRSFCDAIRLDSVEGFRYKESNTMIPPKAGFLEAEKMFNS